MERLRLSAVGESLDGPYAFVVASLELKLHPRNRAILGIEVTSAEGGCGLAGVLLVAPASDW